MSYEQKVLSAAIKTREAYEVLEPHVANGDFTEQAALIWRGVRDYYERDRDCRSCDPDLLARSIGRTLASEKHRAQITGIIGELSEGTVSPGNVIHDFIAVRREAAADRLANALISGQHDNKTSELLAEYEKWLTAETLEEEEREQVFDGMPLGELIGENNEDNLIKLWPTALNNRLDGGLMRGHHVVLFARPEMGKTLFVVNAIAGFLEQNLRVIYFGNEDPIKDVNTRIVSRLARCSKLQFLENPEAAYEKAVKEGYTSLLRTVELTPGTPRQIEEQVEDYIPDVIIIDQLRNLNFKEDNYVQKLEKLALAVRTIGKRHDCLVLSVTQAGDSASGKQILDMGDVDNSNTGIPAQADVMVGIGASQEDEIHFRRVLSLPKNKRGGNHDPVTVRIEPHNNKIQGF